MKEKINAYILAGEGSSSRTVYGLNKSFLTIKGYPLFLYVLAALDRVDQVEQIYLVGPRIPLVEAIEKGKKAFGLYKKVEVVEQRENLLANLVRVFAYSLPGFREGDAFDPVKYPNLRDEVGLFVSADTPLLTPEEIQEFLLRSDMETYDYCMGVTSQEVLKHFYPKGGHPGIRMAYFHLHQKAYRINNLHLARPFRVGQHDYFQRMYDARYQKTIRNILRVSFGLLGTRCWLKAFMYYMLVQSALFFSSINFRHLALLSRSYLRRDSLEQAVCEILQTRFKTVETSFGGAALDVDNEPSYDTIVKMYDVWQDWQKQRILEHGQPAGIPQQVGG